MKVLKYTFKDNAIFRPYDRNSPYVFDKIRDLISQKIPDAKIEHVGSTAVGCGGKGIIDILVVHPKVLRKRMYSLGFQPGVSKDKRIVFVGSVMYRKKRYDTHIHMLKPEHQTVKNMIYLRNYLMKNPSKVRQYETLKKKAISEGKVLNKEYNPVKAPLIRKIIDR